MNFRCGICGHWNCYAGGFKHPTKLFESMPHPYILGKDCMFESDLPEMSDNEYAEWFKKSEIVFGVRMGPVFPPNAKISGAMAVPRGAEQDRGGQLEVNRAERKELSGEETP